MKIVRLAFALVFLPLTSMLSAQAQPAAKAPGSPSMEPFVVDVHSSPYRATIYYRLNLGDQRLDMRDATLLDMINVAYNHLDNDGAVLGGPTWIDFDHFDVVAKVPSLKPPSQKAEPADPANPGPNPYDQVRPVLKQVLAERFHLIYHDEDRPLPGFVATVAKGGVKFGEAKDATAPNACQGVQDKANPGQYTVTCTSETLAQFFSSFGIYPHPVVDHTGLTKKYDFTFKIDVGQLRSREEYVRVFTDALSRQLGLVVVPGVVPQPAMVIDTVDRLPTANRAEVAKLIPAMPDLEFEVASIRPAAANEPVDQIRPTGSQITFTNFPLQQLLVNAWQLPTGAMLGNAPSWLDHVKYTIQVKLPPDIDGRAVFQNMDQLDNMLQKLLIDRFQLKFHWGEQKQDGYVLLAGNPKMKKADPKSRSFCRDGAPDGEKDVRTAPGSPFDNEFHCQNVTMDQFADLAQPMARSEIKSRVPNKTGLEGGYDFTLYYTSGHKMRVDATAAAAAGQSDDVATTPGAGNGAAEPVVAESIEDAFRKQLGLKLEKQPLALPSLVIDHIEQTPTEN